MIRTLARPRTGSLATSTAVAVFTWLQTDLAGLDRFFTALAAFVAAYLVFNASAALVERYA